MRGRRRQLKQAIPKILDIVNVFGPALNPSLTFHLPASRLTNSKEMMSELQQMRQTAAHYNLGYLSANQVESIYRMFLVHPALAKVTSLNSKVLTKGIYSNPEDYLAFINPETVEGTDAEEMEESCLTFPFMKFYCTRFRTVRVKYRN